MSNEHMEQPTPEQVSQVKAATDALVAAADQARNIEKVIGRLRSELNESRTLFAKLQEVVGTGTYPFRGETTYRQTIASRIAKIEEALK